MADLQEKIEDIIGQQPTFWYIGVCINPHRVKHKLGFPTFWNYWLADSLSHANDVITHFKEKGCVYCTQTLNQKDLNKSDNLYLYIY